MSFIKKALDILPTAICSRLVGAVSEIQLSPRLQFIVNSTLAKLVHANLDEAEKPVEEYASLHELFTRKLKPGAREIANADVVSPVDGRLSFMGRLQKGCLVEAKGHEYYVRDLVGTHRDDLVDWLDDAFAFTIYLSPSNYHRIHMPATGAVTHCAYAPGRLLPVNRIGYMLTDDLLPENERLTSFIDAGNGRRCALVKVGATCVGRISVVYDDFKTNTTFHKAPFCRELDTPWDAKAGDALACFELGSTVVLMVSGKGFVPDESLQIGQPIRMGNALGNWSADAD